MEKEITDQKQELKKELTELRGQIQQVHQSTQHIEVHTAGLCGLCEGRTLRKVFTFGEYSQRKRTDSMKEVDSDPFYSHQDGYKFMLRIAYYDSPYYGGSRNGIGTTLYLRTGEYDDQLPWPVNVTVRLELLNQAGDHHHVEWTKTRKWGEDKRNSYRSGSECIGVMQYSDLEKRGDGVQYMMNNCLKFRLHLTVQAA